MRRKIVLPLVLVIAGIFVLIGCIPIPGNNKLDDGRPRPEASIGELSSDKPIKVRGSTTEQVVQTFGPPTMRSDDGRFLVYSYRVNDISVFWPLCFFLGANQQFHDRHLLLRFDDVGRLQSFKTYKDLTTLKSDVNWTPLQSVSPRRTRQK